MVFVLQKTNLTLKEVGKLFHGNTGTGYHHSTVTHARDLIRELIIVHKPTKAEYEKIQELL